MYNYFAHVKMFRANTLRRALLLELWVPVFRVVSWGNTNSYFPSRSTTLLHFSFRRNIFLSLFNHQFKVSIVFLWVIMTSWVFLWSSFPLKRFGTLWLQSVISCISHSDFQWICRRRFSVAWRTGSESNHKGNSFFQLRKKKVIQGGISAAVICAHSFKVQTKKLFVMHCEQLCSKVTQDKDLDLWCATRDELFQRSWSCLYSPAVSCNYTYRHHIFIYNLRTDHVD